MRELRSEVNALSDPVDQAFVRDFQYSTIATPVPDAFMDCSDRQQPADAGARLEKGVAGPDGIPAEAPRPDVRTLVLGGDRDAVFSVDEQTALAREFPAPNCGIIDGIGHTLHWERPQRFVDELLRFAS